MAAGLTQAPYNGQNQAKLFHNPCWKDTDATHVFNIISRWCRICCWYQVQVIKELCIDFKACNVYATKGKPLSKALMHDWSMTSMMNYNNYSPRGFWGSTITGIITNWNPWYSKSRKTLQRILITKIVIIQIWYGNIVCKLPDFFKDFAHNPSTKVNEFQSNFIAEPR